MSEKPTDSAERAARDDDAVHFGRRTVGRGEKRRLVDAVFTSVASRYDLMNDLMSFGAHRAWKRVAAWLCAPRPGQRILDLAGGTGDLAALLWRATGGRAEITLADCNADMLRQGRDRQADRGFLPDLVRCDARALPFPDNHFDRIVAAFGVRNFADPEGALRAMRRALKPGGRVVILEFSKVRRPLRPLYDFWTRRCIPPLGRLVVGDADSYRYLVESIRVHPDQQTFKRMIEDAGFARCKFFNLGGGVVAAHRACKL